MSRKLSLNEKMCKKAHFLENIWKNLQFRVGKKMKIRDKIVHFILGLFLFELSNCWVPLKMEEKIPIAESLKHANYGNRLRGKNHYNIIDHKTYDFSQLWKSKN